MRDTVLDRGQRIGRGRFALRLTLNLCLLALLAVWIDLGAVVRRLADTKAVGLAVVLALMSADRFLMAYKWWLLLRARRLPVSFWSSVRAYYLASFAGLFLPVTVGADTVRILALSRTTAVSELVASIVVERSVGALAHLIMAGIALAVFARQAERFAVGGLWVVGGAILIGAGLLAFSFSLATLGSRWRDRAGLRGRLGTMLAAYADYRSLQRLLVIFFGLTIVEGFFPVAVNFVAARALGLALPFSIFLATIPIALLVARMPIFLSGFGAVESSFVYLAGLTGVARPDALAIAVVADAALLVALLPGAVAYLLPTRELDETQACPPPSEPLISSRRK